MNVYIGQYGVNVDKINSIHIFDEENRVVNTKRLKAFLNQAKIKTSNIEEQQSIIESLFSFELIHSLFKNYDKYILIGAENKCINFLYEYKGNKQGQEINIEQLALFLLGDEACLQFIGYDEVLKSVDANYDDISQATAKFYKEYIEPIKNSTNQMLEITLSLSNGIRIVLDLVEFAIKLREIIHSDIQIKYCYALFDKNENKLSWININEEKEEIKLIEELKNFLTNYSKVDLSKVENHTENKIFYDYLNDFYYGLQTANLEEVEYKIKKIVAYELEPSENKTMELTQGKIQNHFRKFIPEEQLDYRLFLNNLIKFEYFQLAITLCEGLIRTRSVELVELKNTKEDPFYYPIENEVNNWIVSNYALDNFINNYRNMRKYGSNGKPIYEKGIHYNPKGTEVITLESAKRFKKKLQGRNTKQYADNFKQFKEFRNKINHGRADGNKTEQQFKQCLELGYYCINFLEELKHDN